MLKVKHLYGINPFEWDAFKCPVCKKNEFVSISHTGVFCSNCGCKFVVDCTNGDPGCVVFAKVWDPNTNVIWLHNETEDVIEKHPSDYILILKIKDYCSQWLRGDDFASLGFPTQEEWEKYQEEHKITF